ncbi:MAG: DUF4160 domain-containing protein [Rickettsiales bacterium]|nr:DUF4160 domain-containing protein [Rickettsiales bacterium]
MPEISRFLGIIVKMYFQDHNPPHFHVTYEKYEASINMDNFTIIEGNLPPRIYSLIIEWAALHRDELLDNWIKTKNLQSPKKIKPLV